MDFNKSKEYIGNIQQLFPFKEYRFCGGRADGVRAVDISNGKDLEITVLADRAMDIFQIRYKGINLNYISPNGISSPAYYSSHTNEFMRNFFGGFLTTCGLSSIGKASENDNKQWQMHGRISASPAERFGITLDTDGDNPKIFINGTMTEAALFDEQMELKREISLEYGSNVLEIEDMVTNIGYSDAGHMILYHFNMGYPLLGEDAEVFVPSFDKKARTPLAQKDFCFSDKVLPPQENFEERCYYHSLKPNNNGYSGYGCFNKGIGIGIFIEYNSVALDHFIQWNMFGKGEYVLGLETANCHVDSRQTAVENDELKYLKGQSAVKYKHFIHFVSNYEEFESLKDRYKPN